VGPFHRCVDDAAIGDEATAIAKQLSTQPTYGLGLIKRVLNARMANTLAGR
jgi:2-(1,2-epoxy-1,2-dihydrophenyl)acetyl-CoA isomerase